MTILEALENVMPLVRHGYNLSQAHKNMAVQTLENIIECFKAGWMPQDQYWSRELAEDIERERCRKLEKYDGIPRLPGPISCPPAPADADIMRKIEMIKEHIGELHDYPGAPLVAVKPDPVLSPERVIARECEDRIKSGDIFDKKLKNDLKLVVSWIERFGVRYTEYAMAALGIRPELLEAADGIVHREAKGNELHACPECRGHGYRIKYKARVECWMCRSAGVI